MQEGQREMLERPPISLVHSFLTLDLPVIEDAIHIKSRSNCGINPFRKHSQKHTQQCNGLTDSKYQVNDNENLPNRMDPSFSGMTFWVLTSI